MTAAPALASLTRRLRRRAAVRPAHRSARPAWTFDGLHRIEVVAPDSDCAALLLEYATPLFPAELVPGAPLTVRLQPPPTGPEWVIELLALVERWLEAAPLPCAKLLYGGRSYLIRSSDHVAELVAGPSS